MLIILFSADHMPTGNLDLYAMFVTVLWHLLAINTNNLNGIEFIFHIFHRCIVCSRRKKL